MILLVLGLFTVGIQHNPVYNQNRNVSPASSSHYDLIVFGAEPEGIAAAAVAGEKGLSVLLLDDRDAIGGLMTLGGLNFIDMNYDKKGVLLTRGIFQRFYERVGGNAFEIAKAEEVFTTFLLDAGVELELQADLQGVEVEGRTIREIRVLQKGAERVFTADFFVDTSTDGVLAAMAGVPYTIFGEDIGKPDRLMGVTLVFEVADVNWPRVFTHLNYNRILGKRAGDERQFYGAKWKTAWGYSVEGYQYQPQDENMRLRGLNVARQSNGNVLINALIIFDVNPLDPESKRQAFLRGEKELVHIIPYLQEHFTGFEKARLAGTARDLYVRESRHFLTRYVLSIDDVLENRSFPDQIAIGSYPVDVQPAGPGDWGTIVGNPDRYGIPYGSLLPGNLDNLLLAGKQAGYTSLAAGSARVIPIGMATAEAAALAAVTARERGLDFTQVGAQPEAFAGLQEKIRSNGGYIDTFSVPNPLEGVRGYEEMKVLRRLGLVAGGYHNVYPFEAYVDQWTFDHLLGGVLAYHGRSPVGAGIDQYPTWGSITALISGLENGNLGISGLAVPENSSASFSPNLAFLRERGMLEGLTVSPEDRMVHPKMADIYILLRNYHFYLTN